MIRCPSLYSTVTAYKMLTISTQTHVTILCIRPDRLLVFLPSRRPGCRSHHRPQPKVAGWAIIIRFVIQSGLDEQTKLQGQKIQKIRFLSRLISEQMLMEPNPAVKCPWDFSFPLQTGSVIERVFWTTKIASKVTKLMEWCVLWLKGSQIRFQCYVPVCEQLFQFQGNL